MRKGVSEDAWAHLENRELRREFRKVKKVIRETKSTLSQVSSELDIAIKAAKGGASGKQVGRFLATLKTRIDDSFDDVTGKGMFS